MSVGSGKWQCQVVEVCHSNLQVKIGRKGIEWSRRIGNLVYYKKILSCEHLCTMSSTEFQWIIDILPKCKFSISRDGVKENLDQVFISNCINLNGVHRNCGTCSLYKFGLILRKENINVKKIKLGMKMQFDQITLREKF